MSGSFAKNNLQHTATHCNTLQHTATHCNTLQHTATLSGSFAKNNLQLKGSYESWPLCSLIRSLCDVLPSEVARHFLQKRHSVLQCVAVCCRVLQCVHPQRVTFCKRGTHHKALLRRRTYKDKASEGSSPLVDRTL